MSIADIANLVFTPNTDFNGTTSFEFFVTDDGGTENGGEDTAQAANTITFEIGAANDPAIIAGDDTGSVTEDGTLVTSGTLTATDVDNPDDLFIVRTNAQDTTQFGSFSIHRDVHRHQRRWYTPRYHHHH